MWLSSRFALQFVTLATNRVKALFFNVTRHLVTLLVISLSNKTSQKQIVLKISLSCFMFVLRDRQGGHGLVQVHHNIPLVKDVPHMAHHQDQAELNKA